MRLLLIAATTVCSFAVSSFAACQPPEQPPVVPPAPPDPNVAGALALRPAEVIDASIVDEPGGLDGTIFELDAGAIP